MTICVGVRFASIHRAAGSSSGTGSGGGSNMMRGLVSGMVLLSALTAMPPLAAQDARTPAESENAIVVTAQRSGAPMWIVETPSGTVILVGEIRAIPETTPWEPARLEEATRAADRVILGARPKISPGDIFRLMFSGGKLTKLPDKTVAADYLDAAQLQRLEALAAAQPGALVGAEVDRAVGDRAWVEGARERGQGRRHALDELVAAPLLDQQPGVVAGERLEHHQFGAQQPDAVDVERRGAFGLRGLGEIDEQFGVEDGRGRS